MKRWLMFSLSLFPVSFLLLGCGAQTNPKDPSMIVNQISGPFRTSFNGQAIRTRNYQGVRNYEQDNVTIFVTELDGSTSIYESKP